MLIRCVVPVRLKTSHCASGIARCSPIASATITPAYGAAPSARNALSRTLLARTLHVIDHPPGEGLDARVVAAGTHVARRAQLVLQQPCLEVEAVRVDGAVRTLEADGEAPPFRCADDGHIRGAIACARKPCERQPRGHHGTGREDALDREREARAARRRARQLVDHAHERDVDALPARPATRRPGAAAHATLRNRSRRTCHRGTEDAPNAAGPASPPRQPDASSAASHDAREHGKRDRHRTRSAPADGSSARHCRAMRLGKAKECEVQAGHTRAAR